MNTPPIVTVEDLVVLLGESINGTDLASASDPDGDPITKWRFMNTLNTPDAGHFEVGGIRRDPGFWITLNAAQLGNLEYVSAAAISRDTIRVQVFDGTDWSDVGQFFMYSAIPNTQRPQLFVTPFDLVAYEKIRVSDWVAASDPDGWPITRWKFRDRTVGDRSGYFALDGVKQTEGDWFYVEADELDKLYYISARFGQVEVVDARVRDTEIWSFPEAFFATTHENAARPVVVAATHIVPKSNAGYDVTLPMDTFVDAFDPDGNTIKAYRFYDTSPGSTSGFVSVDGVKQPSKTWIEVDIPTFRKTSFTAAATQMTDNLRVRAFDGKHWSSITTIKIQADPKPSIGHIGSLGPASPTMLNGFFDSVFFGDIIFQDDAGKFFQKYQVIDTNTNPISGTLSLKKDPDNPNGLSDGQIHEVSPGDFNFLEFTGAVGGRSTDDVYIRAFNGLFWSDWERVQIRTEVGIGGISGWNGLLPQTPPQPIVVTYSFAGFYRNDDRLTGDASSDTFQGVDFEMQQAFRRQFQVLNRLVENATFIEVPDSYVDPVTGVEHGLIRIHGWAPLMIDPMDPPPCAFTYGPTDHITELDQSQEGGDIWITYFPFAPITFCGGVGAPNESFNNAMAAREILTAVGLGGPAVPPTLSLPAGVDPDLGLLGSVPLARGDGLFPRTFGLLDAFILQQTYGADVDTNNGNNVYDILGYWKGDFSAVDIIYDTGGYDILDTTASITNDFLTIEQGEYSKIGFVAEPNIGITYSTLLEEIHAGSGNDTLVGNDIANVLNGGAGNDDIFSAGGNDLMIGGAGNDNYHWNIVDGFDTINEQQMAGKDRITIPNLTLYGLDDLAQDVSFRKQGRDLIIDFQVDGDYPLGSLRIKDQKWGGSRIETLAIFGVDVDLTDIYSKISSADSHFDINFGAPLAFGFGVTPAV